MAGHMAGTRTLRADDHLLMNGPLGLAQQRCMSSMVLACGTALTRTQREQLLELPAQCSMPTRKVPGGGIHRPQ